MSRTASTRKPNDVTDTRLNPNGYVADQLSDEEIRSTEEYRLASSWARSTPDHKTLAHAFTVGHGYQLSEGLEHVITVALDDVLTEALDVVTVANVAAEQVTWLWHNRVPHHKLTLLWGDPGQNKSWLTLELAARITRGEPLPEDNVTGEIGNVLILTSEDGVADTIRPRLEALGANLNRVDVLKSVKSADGKRHAVSLQTDLDLIGHQVSKRGYALIIVDPIDAYLGSGKDSFKNPDMRAVLDPLAEFAERKRVTLLAIQHLTKSQRDRAIYRGQGSIAFLAAARSVLFVGTDPNDGEQRRRVLHCIKHNLAEEPPGALAFEVRHSAFEWLGESHVSIAALMDPDQSADDRSELDDAENYLTQLLANGPVKATMQYETADREHGISPATLRRAKSKLNIKSVKGKGDAYSNWYWVGPGQVPVLEDEPPPF
jgi:hypothetical protein